MPSDTEIRIKDFCMICIYDMNFGVKGRAFTDFYSLSAVVLFMVINVKSLYTQI